jgi:hypothetical protein
MFSKIAAAVLAFCAVGAQAASTFEVTGFTFGSEGMSINRSSTDYPGYIGVEAGALNATYNGASFMTYCIDVYQTASIGTIYTDYAPKAGSLQFTGTQATDLGRLFTSYGSLVDTKIESAAMQLAVWEIVDETRGFYDVNNGRFSAILDRNSDAAVATLANSWLSNLGTNNVYNVSALSSATHQDFLVLAPVPEPSTYALMLAGLMGVGFVARRRKNGAGN